MTPDQLRAARATLGQMWCIVATTEGHLSDAIGLTILGFDLAKKPETKDEITTMICLSTAHLTEKSSQDFEGPHKIGTMPIFYEKKGYGWFVYVTGMVDGDKGYPDDLRAILAYARARGCTWIMLDQDGLVVDGLPTFEW
jgi:hypothetical protein